MMDWKITFAGCTLDRRAELRGDAASLTALAAREDARTLPMWRGKPLFSTDGPDLEISWQPLDAAVLAEATEPPLFMGMADGAPRFAHDVSSWEDPAADRDEMARFVDRSTNTHPALPDGQKFIDLRSVMGEISAEDAGDAAVAKGIFAWHESHTHCARCGARSAFADAGWQRKCPECHASHFPRTDPVVIMLVTHGDRALLGRSPGWPEGMYSLLAGFMEPGETIEAAAAREVFEESGVRLGPVDILTSQPWPFPASLMIACRAEAEHDAITIDENELEDAAWFSRQSVMESIAGLEERHLAARPGSIARSVLEAWVANRI